MDKEFLLDDEAHSLSLEKKGDVYQIKIGEKALEADIQQLDPNTLSFLIEGRSYRAYIAQDKDRCLVQILGHQFELREPSQDSDGFLGGAGRSQEDDTQHGFIARQRD